jgi:hypothetical protein
MRRLHIYWDATRPTACYYQLITLARATIPASSTWERRATVRGMTECLGGGHLCDLICCHDDAMNLDGYWHLVWTARSAVGEQASVDEIADRVVALLVEQGPAEIRDADNHFMTLAAQAYGWPLWGAAYVMNGGCSDDGFDYFLGWLVGQGREVFERAVTDPDSLADVVTADEVEFESEEFSAAAQTAAHQLTGRYETGAAPVSRPQLGEGWDFDDEVEMRARYPRLTDLFLG